MGPAQRTTKKAEAQSLPGNGGAGPLGRRRHGDPDQDATSSGGGSGLAQPAGGTVMLPMPYLRIENDQRALRCRGIFGGCRIEGWCHSQDATWSSLWVEPVVITTSPLQIHLWRRYQVG